MSRISLPTFDSMSDAQRVIYNNIVNGPRGRLVGPLRAVLHNPELAERWQRLGEILRFGSSLPRKLNELAILVTARRWNSQIEWLIHSQDAAEHGLDKVIIDAIEAGEVPKFKDREEAIAYEYARQLQERGTVADNVYDEAKALWGELGVVDLTALIGYYTMVSMTLNVHEIPMPDGQQPPLVAPVEGGEITLSHLSGLTVDEWAS